jgi:hypothetical protein
MAVECSHPMESALAPHTFKSVSQIWFLPRVVQLEMITQPRVTGKRGRAKLALVRLPTLVYKLVSVEIRAAMESFGADATLVRPVLCVCLFMLLQDCQSLVRHGAVRAFEGARALAVGQEMQAAFKHRVKPLPTPPAAIPLLMHPHVSP